MTTLNVARIYLRVSTEDQDLQRQEAIIGSRREGRPNQPSLLPSPL
ncbi:stability/partitioning determinant, partial [Pseudomonas syringae]